MIRPDLTATRWHTALRRSIATICLLLSASVYAQDPPPVPFSTEGGEQQIVTPTPGGSWVAEEPLEPCQGGYCCKCSRCRCKEVWHGQVLPDGLIYRSYLAGVKESRFGSTWFSEREQGALWDIALGGRVGIYRYGTSNSLWPEGWQLDIEGAAFPRLDPEEEFDVVSTDFRFGIPITYGEGPYQTKLAYYHLSSHLGDEFLLKNLNIQRINYVRDAIVWGHSYYWTSDLRLYWELEYAFKTDGGAEPLAMQFGADFSPANPTGLRGAPFAAINAYLREEFDFGGHFVAQAGWQWRGGCTNKLLRIGLHYFNGKSPQWEFFDQFEEQIGAGIWYDY